MFDELKEIKYYKAKVLLFKEITDFKNLVQNTLKKENV